MYGVPGGLVQMFRGSTTMFDRAFGDFYDSMAKGSKGVNGDV